MFLKRLELNGFKSFAGKTVLDFPKGVTAIVGPNGSGKSNVIDAIRWLLGERDAKSLRGGKIEDLIFAGTDGKAKLGVAAAALIFDNSSKFFPVDFNEVEIKRQIARDGESSYFINKSEVRLKDIIELLSKSRLGTKGVIVVGQGNSDIFIKANPVERREMVEEILGLREFRIKKEEAERKLRNTFINTDKVKALIEEVLPHLRFLKKQTAKWERRSEVEEQLEILEKNFFGSKRAEIEKNFFGLDPKESELSKKEGLTRRELREKEEELKKVEDLEPESRALLVKIRARREEVLRKKNVAEKELGGLEVRLLMAEKEEEKGQVDSGKAVSFLEEVFKKAKEVVESGFNVDLAVALVKKIAEGGEKIFSFSEKREAGAVEEIRAKQKKNYEEVDIFDREIKEINAKEAGLERNLEKFTDNFKKAFTEVEKVKEEVNRILAEKNKVVLEKEKWNFKLQELKAQVEQAGRSWNTFSLKDAEFLREEELIETEKKIFKLRGELFAMGEVDQALVKEAKETEDRHNFLVTQIADLLKASEDLKEMIRNLAEKIHEEFNEALVLINKEFDKFFKMMFKGGHAKLLLRKEEVVAEGEEGEERKENEEAEKVIIKEARDIEAGLEINLSLPKKKVTNLEVLSGGERSLVSLAALFGLISVSPPPFLVLDEVDAPLDEKNALRFAEMIKDFSEKLQFIVVTHNRATMEAADVLYGLTLGEDGASKVVSLKLS